MSDAIVLPVENKIQHHHHDTFFVDHRINAFPIRMQKTIGNSYSYHYEKEGRQFANLWLLNAVEYTEGKTLLVLDDDAIKVKAESLAHRFKSLTLAAAEIEIVRHGLEMPAGETDESRLARAQCPMWWQRSLRRKQDKEQEMLSIQLGFVRKGCQPYCSTALLKRIQARQERAQEIMEKMEAASSEGDVLNMWEVLEKSLANPAIRRAELMVRMRGMEDYATNQGHAAMFYTITCPSKYHRYSGHSLNPKYADYSPKEAQSYLTALWSQIRAKLKRDGLNVYGFRVAEPHHDGCPHWHMLLFMEQGHCEAVSAVIRDYAMREDGEEAGAAEHRFEAVAIKSEKGSATGYIAKYISKNIDAFGMEEDADSGTGKTASDSAKRVRAWASVWNIRQFQQIGGAPVGVWRELRRLKEQTDVLARLEGLALDAYEAATGADWCEYLTLQGGGNVDRKDQPLRTYRTVPEDDAGNLKTNRYGEVVQVVKGVTDTHTGVMTQTRCKEWTIRMMEAKKGGEAEPIIFNVSPASSADLVGDVARSFNDAEFLQAGGSSALPWSSINNCTRLNHDGAALRFSGW